MKMPKSPPNLEEIEPNVTWSRVLTAVPGPLVKGKYIHWDKLIHLPPPEGIDHESWWFVLKMHRAGQKYLPLLDRKGQEFSFLQVDPIPERLHEIDMGAGGLIAMPEQITNPETKNQYYIGSLIEEAITSSQLEGAATTRQVAKDMIRAGRRPKDKSEQMILNNFRTMQRISQLKNEPMSRDLVLEIHRLITEGTMDDPSAAGRFRRADEHIVVAEHDGTIFHDPPAATELDKRIERLCKFANAKSPDYFIHPVLRAIVLHFWLAYDHPFVDGNGRTARALFYWSMLRSGFWLFEFISISNIILKAPAQYNRAFLYTETDANDVTYFIIYQLEVIRRAVASLHEYIARKTKELRVVELNLRTVSVLNHRQRGLVAHALRHPNQLYTIESHRLSNNISYQTARTDLLALVRRGLLEAVKSGKTWVFRPLAGLDEKLKRLK